MFKETKNLELKEKVSNTFLKTVSAFANYRNGEIYFGVSDNGEIVGIDDYHKEAMTIEQRINTTIFPRPDFSIFKREENGKAIIVLQVKKGKDTPYLYQNKAYKRSDTSTVTVDQKELRRLALYGSNLKYEQLSANTQNLTFKTLEHHLIQITGIKKINIDILRTMNLYDLEDKYNIAGELLADLNTFQFTGTDIVRFGENENIFNYRETIAGKSLLTQYERTLELFKQYYEFEVIEGFKRVKKALIPYEAFREALANAVVHREYDSNAHIQVSMYDEKIVISSPGGLPEGINEEEYLKGQISSLRNPIIAAVFNRLDIIEMFGTGVKRIKDEYQNSFTKPIFNLTENNIIITLPLLQKSAPLLDEDEEKAFSIFAQYAELTRNQIEEMLGVNKSKAIRIINSLLEKNLIKREGTSTATTYKKI